MKEIVRSASVNSLGISTCSSTWSRRDEQKEYMRRKFVMSISLLCLRRGFFGMSNLKRMGRGDIMDIGALVFGFILGFIFRSILVLFQVD